MNGFYDCHTHEVNKQTGGFLIALDGRRGSEGGYSNKEVNEKALSSKMIPVQYVTYTLDDDLETSIIKYHPRREKYSTIEVKNHIEKHEPKAVIIDTLNQPFWQPKDYWEIAINNPHIQFLFSHAGGFDINDFLMISMFQKNVWIDFSFTQHVFGWCGDNIPMPVVVQAIDYSMKDKRIFERLLFGSDSMRNEEDLSIDALESYKKYESFNRVIKTNFELFLEKSKL